MGRPGDPRHRGRVAGSSEIFIPLYGSDCLDRSRRDRLGAGHDSWLGPARKPFATERAHGRKTRGFVVKLAVIGRRLCEPLTGVGRYMEALLGEWGRGESAFEQILVYVPGTPHLDDEAFGAKVEFRVVPSSLPPLVWENIVLPAAMDKFDILFAPYTLPWGLARRGVVSNLGIYESRPGDFPTWERLRSTPFFHHSVGEARLVIANSDSTRDDLVRFYGARRESTRVILPGVDAAYTPMDSEYSAQTGMSESICGLSSATATRLGIRKPFFLFVGKLSRRRNIPLLLEAFAGLTARNGGRHSLVIVGEDTSGVGVQERAAALRIGDDVVHVPYAERETLVELYRAAQAFVLPTLHEGFSFTLLEAMACGAPAVVFDHASLENGVRQAVRVCDRADAAGLREALNEVACDEGLRARLRFEGLALAAGMPWSKTAAETQVALLEAANR